MQVVREMVILAQTSNYQKCIKKANKIPDYAREYRNEYLFIRGINKTCGEFVKKLGREEIFKSPQADSLMRNFNKFLKAQELGYLNDTSEISLKYKDIKSTESEEEYYKSKMFDSDSDSNDEIYYRYSDSDSD